MTVKRRKPFGERLKALLDVRGISQFEFARTFKIDQSTVSRYMSMTSEPRLSLYRQMVAKFPELDA
jgi:transcriptional regulator with XRE-family HTH domain